jgi:ubiquinone/menaquinone biosynthesis C-methylase UbiE
MDKKPRYIPAFHFYLLNFIYDPILRLVREKTFKTALVKQAGLEKGHRALDIGCGTATLTILIKRACGDCEVLGLDGDPAILEVARRKIARAGLSITLIDGTAAALPFPDSSFDRVFTSLVLHHLSLEDRTHALKEILRVLKPGGELHIAELGKPHNALMAVISQVVGRLESAWDFVKGLLPETLTGAGFIQVAETYRIATVFGTFALYRAQKPQ